MSNPSTQPPYHLPITRSVFAAMRQLIKRTPTARIMIFAPPYERSDAVIISIKHRQGEWAMECPLDEGTIINRLEKTAMFLPDELGRPVEVSDSGVEDRRMLDALSEDELGRVKDSLLTDFGITLKIDRPLALFIHEESGAFTDNRMSNMTIGEARQLARYMHRCIQGGKAR